MSFLAMKKNPTGYLLFCLASLFVFNSVAYAQTKTGHEGWYQVEMIVFARKNDVGQEHWPSNIKLRYPNNWVELKDPNAISGPNATNSTDAQTAAANTTIDLTKDAFYLLPQNERQLNAEAQKLARNSHFDVLFHQAWRQIIGHKSTAKNIIISGGKQFGQYQELEGTISLSVATYLKLQTNLWFSQFDVNIGQEQTIQWPEIPVRPNYTKLTDLALDADVDLTQALAKENNAWNNGETVATDVSTTDGSTTEPQDGFMTRQIILVKQARDMRSNEVHYVDHPVVGIILKVIPYTANTNAIP